MKTEIINEIKALLEHNGLDIEIKKDNTFNIKTINNIKELRKKLDYIFGEKGNNITDRISYSLFKEKKIEDLNNYTFDYLLRY